MKRKKILIITSRFPFPLDKGDKLRMYHQIKDLSHYHDIYLVSINSDQKINKKDLQEINKYCKKVIVINLNKITIIYNLIQSIIKKEPLQLGYFYSKNIHKKIKSIIKNINPDWCYSQLIRTSK